MRALHLEIGSGARVASVVVVIATLTLAAFAPSSTPSEFAQNDDRGSAAASDPVSQNIQQLVSQSSWQPGKAVLDWNALREFYSERQFEPAWSSSDDAARVHETLAHADREGLDQQDYRADRIIAPQNGDAASTARYDLLLTDALFHYAHDVRVGRVAPEQVYNDAALPKQRYDAAKDLESALNGGGIENYLAALPPAHERYRSLRDLLAHFP